MKTFDVECFWCDPLPVADVILRRFHGLDHDAAVVIGEVELSLGHYPFSARIHASYNGQEIKKTDPRWPGTCRGCEYTFTESDGYVVWTDRKYKHAATGEVYDFYRPMPIGAMSWVPLSVGAQCGNDTVLESDGQNGRCIIAVVPCGLDSTDIYHGHRSHPRPWHIDELTAGEDLRHGTGKIGRTWTRSGTPPRITVTEGIHCPCGFIGNIVDGRLTGRYEKTPNG